MKRIPRNTGRAALSLAVGASLMLTGVGAASAATGQGTDAVPGQGEEYRTTSPSDRLVGDIQGSSSDSLMTQVRAQPFVGRVDAHNAHKSGSQASGHVTWTLMSGASRKITLTSTLKARTSWFTFRTMAGPVSATVEPGGGRGKAAVARYDCRNSSNRDWYTYGEGFVPGAAKPFGSHSSNITVVACDGGLS